MRIKAIYVRRAIGAVLLLAIALLLLSYGSLLRRVEAANEAFHTRNYAVAEQRYPVALGPFHRFKQLRNLLRPHYEDALFNYVQLLYARGKYSDVVDLLERESVEFPKIAGTGPYHLWMGNALFRTAVLQTAAKKEMETESLQSVADEYQKAIELNRADWNAKHNYEFVKSLLARRTSRNAKDQDTLQLLLGEIRMTSEQKTGERPEKLQ